jgi:hypothetical protein
MISEPTTLATDYLLALLTAVLAVLILRTSGRQQARRLWGSAFIALALGAALGGTYHGFDLDVLWKPTLFAVGIASLGMICGSAYAATRGAVRYALLALALLKFVAFLIWISRDSRFVWVVADTGISFALVALLHVFAWRAPGSRWVLAGVAFSVAAAAAQASGMDLHRHFNHNDVYHVVQALAMLAYYAGVRRLRDA